MFRTPEDCAAILAAARGARHACVIGGGLLGLEAARGLLDQGVPVTVVHLEGHLMERQLDAGAARCSPSGCARSTWRCCWTRRPRGSWATARPRPAVRRRLRADVRRRGDLRRHPGRPTLARDAGLDCGRGIVVDDALRTADPRVWAVGECAEHRGMVYGLVAPIHDQARVAADAIARRGARAYAGSIPRAKLKVMGVDLVCGGDVADGGCTVQRRRARGPTASSRSRDGRAVGADPARRHRAAPRRWWRWSRAAREVDRPARRRSPAAQAPARRPPRRRAGLQLQRRLQGRHRRRRSESEGCTATARGRGRDPRRAPAAARCKPLVSELRRDRDRRRPPRSPPTSAPAAARRARSSPSRSARDGLRVGQRGVAPRAAPAATAAPASPASPTSSPRSTTTATARSATRATSTTASTRTSRRTARSRSCRGCAAASRRPSELRRIADVAEKYEVPMVKVTGGQRIDLLGRQEGGPAGDLGATSTCRRASPTPRPSAR